ncbi:MAG: GtrA family protein [Erysipelotrichaceae bacterium]|nr:GtrA family protein [Erysipelotrichaceae bacterium]
MIKKLYEKYKELINYLFFGGCTFVVSMVIFYLCNQLLKMNEHLANIISWFFAVLFAYLTNRKYVFTSNASTKEELFKEVTSFYGARLATLGVEEVIIYVGITLLHFNPMIIKVIGQVVVILSNYVLSKLFVFKGE